MRRTLPSLAIAIAFAAAACRPDAGDDTTRDAHGEGGDTASAAGRFHNPADSQRAGLTDASGARDPRARNPQGTRLGSPTGRDTTRPDTATQNTGRTRPQRTPR